VRPPAGRALVDGEAVVFRPDGRSDFEAMLTRRGWESAAYVAFDLLTLNGEGLRLRPLEERFYRGSLSASTASCSARRSRPRANSSSLRPVSSDWKASWRNGRSLYKSGRSRNWLKTRNPAFVRT
jgi:ATP-dependent DNA ligase